MKNAKLEKLQRGTPDLPFSWYHFHFKSLKNVAHTHWHPEQEILYVRSGVLNVMVGKTAYMLHAGDICFVSPNALHNVSTAACNTEYEAFVYSYDLLTLPPSHFFQNAVTAPLRDGSLTLPVVMRNSDPGYRAAVAVIEQLCVKRSNTLQYKLSVFNGLVALYTALTDLLSPVDGCDRSIDNQAVKACIAYLNSHYAEKITLGTLAQAVHLHPNYLCNLFKDYTGQTIFQMLMHIRLEQAANMLQNTDCTVCHAASQCGFDSLSFFSRKFAQIIGMSPKSYSQKYRKNF